MPKVVSYAFFSLSNFSDFPFLTEYYSAKTIYLRIMQNVFLKTKEYLAALLSRLEIIGPEKARI